MGSYMLQMAETVYDYAKVNMASMIKFVGCCVDRLGEHAK